MRTKEEEKNVNRSLAQYGRPEGMASWLHVGRTARAGQVKTVWGAEDRPMKACALCPSQVIQWDTELERGVSQGTGLRGSPEATNTTDSPSSEGRMACRRSEKARMAA